MKQIFAMLFAVAVFIVAVAAEAATLRSEAVILGDRVTLGDLFDGLPPDQAGTAIARAPALGRTVTLDARWLSRLAQAHGIAWDTASGALRIAVSRPSHRLDTAMITAFLRETLAGRMAGDRFELSLDNRAPEADHRVDPFPNPRVLLEITRIDQIHAAGPGDFSVHHHDLSVVAEIDLETVANAFLGVELANLGARRAQVVLVGLGQALAADFIIEKENPHAFLRLGNQVVFDLPADLVVHHSGDDSRAQAKGMRQAAGNVGLSPALENSHIVRPSGWHIEGVQPKHNLAQR